MLDQGLKAANDTEDVGTDSASRPKHVVLVGNFPPRRCGIATFTRDVYEGLTGADRGLLCDVAAMTDGCGPYEYPRAVKYQIRAERLEDYAEVAKAINRSQPDLLCLQHEFGIFGGEAGEHVLTLIYGVSCPVVTSLHTVLQNPSDAYRRVMAGLIAGSARLIVMAEKGKQILCEEYGAPPSKVVVIPHGAPDHPLVDSASFKPALGLEGREVLLTFGLLSPNKGIETMIRAMPAIAAARPNATYVVLGATHPQLVAHEGEAYRDRLIALAQERKVGDRVKFVNAYVDNPTLLKYLAAADIYVTPYLNQAQITSGTLSYAVALGKPVISTPYWHAEELLRGGVGFLVDFNDSDAFAARAIELLSDAGLHGEVRRAAYEAGRGSVWSRVAERHLEVFASAAQQRPMRRSWRRFSLPRPSLRGMSYMSDNCGILQHSAFGVADRAHGYCVDDNARALIVMNRLEDVGRAPAHDHLAGAYAAFVNHAWNAAKGRFRNFMSYDRRWLEEVGSEDSNGRALWAIGDTAERTSHPDLKLWAQTLARAVVPQMASLRPARSRAFAALGLAGLVSTDPKFEAAATTLRDFATDLAGSFMRWRTDDWVWFEPVVSYDNARLPEALIRAGGALGERDWVRFGVEALGWLCALQSAPSGIFRAVGSSGLGKRMVIAPPFDQQALEAAATIDACAAALEATGDHFWAREAQRAYDWFLGGNDLGVSLADPERGLCYDGLTPDGVNLNHGAESILSFQLATCAMRAITRATRTSMRAASA